MKSQRCSQVDWEATKLLCTFGDELGSRVSSPQGLFLALSK